MSGWAISSLLQNAVRGSNIRSFARDKPFLQIIFNSSELTGPQIPDLTSSVVQCAFFFEGEPRVFIAMFDPVRRADQCGTTSETCVAQGTGVNFGHKT